MAFTVSDFHDLVALLEQHPEWRADLRRLVLTEELLALPDMVRALVEAQQRTEPQIATMQQQMVAVQQQMATMQHNIEAMQQQIVTIQQQIAAIQQQMATMQHNIEAMQQQIAELIVAQRRTEQRIERLQDDVGELKGIGLEGRYREHAGSYFGQIVRRAHVLSGNESSILLDDAVEQGLLSEEALHDVALADILVRGRQRKQGTEVYLVVEVSWGIGLYDVERAVRRAALLAQLGVETMPVVAGEHITAEAAELARAMHVWQVLDGRVVAPTNA